MIELDGKVLASDDLEPLLDTHGAVMFRGAGVATVEDFASMVESLEIRRTDYRGGNSPRTQLGDNVYTSTEYSATQQISLHNELSYANSWPNKLIFGCLVPALTGGATSIADGRAILKALSPETVDAFETRGVRYVTNLHGRLGPGRSWQDTFETSDKDEVEQFCNRSGAMFEWLEEDGLRVLRTGPGIVVHPRTGERCWFNQAEQFHPTALPDEVADFLMAEHQGREETLPQWASFGDGGHIPHTMLDEIRSVLAHHTNAPAWGAGDILVVDNHSSMHGRLPFEGERRVVVAMA